MGENAEIDLYEDFNEQHENVRKTSVCLFAGEVIESKHLNINKLVMIYSQGKLLLT